MIQAVSLLSDEPAPRHARKGIVRHVEYQLPSHHRPFLERLLRSSRNHDFGSPAFPDCHLVNQGVENS